ncbi:WD40 repeat domain-containing protein [Schlesneria paludicola]|uniref:WD40 repeat domain-containing protein n=1 Tax=Schlesneria paludicola TaxID=360056 RepID=UPI0002F687D5|nr:hypothetical protein [Schlesneria paludicola]
MYTILKQVNMFRRYRTSQPWIICTAVLSFMGSCGFGAEPIELSIGDEKTASIAFSPDGRYLAVGTFGRAPTTKVFDLVAKKEFREFPCTGRGAAFSVAFSQDSQRLAIADYDLNIQVFNVVDGTSIGALPGDPDRKKYRQARQVSFLSNTKLIAGYSTGELFVWNLETKQVSVKCDHGNPITAIAVSPDGNRIASGTDFGLRIWDSASGKAVVQLDQKSSGIHQVQAIAFLPDGQTVATADSPGHVRFFATSDGKEMNSFKMPSVGKETTVYGLCVTSDGKTAVVPGLLAGIDPTRPKSLTSGILLIDVSTARPRGFVESATAHALALSPDHKWAAISTGDTGDSVMLYDLTKAIPVKP